MGSAEHLQLLDELASQDADGSEPLIPNAQGRGLVRFRFLSPMAVEAQYYAALL